MLMTGKKKGLLIVLAVLTVLFAVLGAAGCRESMPGGDPETPPGVDVKVTLKDGETVLATVTSSEGVSSIENWENREGYSFGGWFSDSDKTQKVSFSAFPTSDCIVYGAWTPHTYTVTFDSGDGAGIMSAVSATYGQRLRLPLNTFVRRNEQFEGWALSRGGEAVYADGASVLNLTAEEGGQVTLYARFDVYDLGDFIIENRTVTGYRGSAENIKLPSSADRVAPEAFVNNGKLKKVIVPDHYVEIGKGAFRNCSALEKLTIPFVGQNEYQNTFLAYLFGADSYKDNFFKVYAHLSNGSLYLDDIVYSENHVPETLNTVVVTGTATSVGEGAFSNCFGLSKVIYSDYSELTHIGASAFRNCPYLGYDSLTQTTVRLDFLRNVTRIGEYAFAAYATEPDAAGENSYILSSLREVAPLEQIEKIDRNAFESCLYLNRVKFGDNLETIGDWAFYRAASLTEINIPDSVESIGNYAFFYNIGLNTLTLGKNVASIGDYAFAACSALFQVTVNCDEMPAVGNIPFSNDLKETTTGSGVTSFTPVFTKFRIYADADRTAEVRDAFGSTYENYIYGKQEPRAPLYFGPTEGGYSAKIIFTEGWVVYIDDPGQVFLKDFSSYMFDIFGNVGETFGTYYPMLLEEVSFDSYENVKVYSLSNPAIQDYDGSAMVEDLVITDVPYENGDETYLLPVAKLRGSTSNYGSDQGKEGTYRVERTRYGVITVRKYVRQGISTTLQEVPAPANTYYASLEELSFQKLYRVTYYDAQFNVLEIRDFFADASGNLWLRDPENVLIDVWMESYAGGRRDYVFLSGDGLAEISVNGTKYTGSYTAPAEGMWEDGYVVTMTGLQESGMQNKYSAVAKFFGYFDNIYHRCDMEMTVNGEKLTWSLYENDGAEIVEARNVEISYWDYIAEQTRKNTNSYYFAEYHEDVVKDRHYIYSYYDDAGTYRFSYAIYRNDIGNIYGNCTIGENGYTFAYDDGTTCEASLVPGDRRGNFIIGNTLYRIYDSEEDYNYYILEDLSAYSRGAVIFYYVIKMDGYGNAYFRDVHEDGIDVEYSGTYYNSGKVVTTLYGIDYYEYVFEADTGETFYFVPDLSLYYEIEYIIDSTNTDTADEDNYAITDYSELLAVITKSGADVYEIVDEYGFKIAEVSVDGYGITSLKQFRYTFNADGSVSYEEIPSDLTVRTATDSEGKISKFAVYDSMGVFLYYYVKDGADYVIEYDAEVSESEEFRAFVPDVSELTPMQKTTL